jgi:hypothetical protein
MAGQKREARLRAKRPGHPRLPFFRVQYSEASRLNRDAVGYRITRFAGDDACRASGQTPRLYSKHYCARGRIALSGVDLRSQGPGGGSKRSFFPRSGGIYSVTGDEVKKSCLSGVAQACQVLQRNQHFPPAEVLAVRPAKPFSHNAGICKAAAYRGKPKGAMIRRTTVFMFYWLSSRHLSSGVRLTR